MIKLFCSYFLVYIRISFDSLELVREDPFCFICESLANT